MNNEKIIWNFLSKTFNPYAVAGIMGNLYAESALNPINLQSSYEKKLGYNDKEYTAAVDNNTYKNFIKDQAGYGLAQWTYWTRKQKLLEFAKSKQVSIGNLEMQCEFLVKELKESYNSSCFAPLQKVTSVREASNIILLKYERPANQSTSVQNTRANYGQRYYDQFAVPVVEEPFAVIEFAFLGKRTLRKGDTGFDVEELQKQLIKLNYNVGKTGADGKYGDNTKNAVKQFQIDGKISADGVFGPKSLALLKSRLLKS